MEGPTKISAEEMDEAVRKVVLSFEIHPSQVARELGVSMSEIFEWTRQLSQKKISYWTIAIVNPPKEELRPGIFVCSHGVPDPLRTAYFNRTVFLRRPGQKPCAAVIHRKTDGTLVLNPNESSPVQFDYGPIPSVKSNEPNGRRRIVGNKRQ